jgi:DNA-binding LacI/PurR family transcriptional regulator
LSYVPGPTITAFCMTVAVFANPSNPAADVTLSALEAAARAMGLQTQVLNASTSREIDAAFATFVSERPDALFVTGAPAHARALAALRPTRQREY